MTLDVGLHLGRERTCHMYMQGTNIPGRGNSQCQGLVVKTLRWLLCLQWRRVTKTGLEMCSFTEGRKHHSKKHICSASLIPRNPEESSSHKICIEPGSAARPFSSPFSHFRSRMVSTEKVLHRNGKFSYLLPSESLTVPCLYLVCIG